MFGLNIYHGQIDLYLCPFFILTPLAGNLKNRPAFVEQVSTGSQVGDEIHGRNVRNRKLLCDHQTGLADLSRHGFLIANWNLCQHSAGRGQADWHLGQLRCR